jgi:hypothetical protein
MPTQTGLYEFRYLYNNGFTDLRATSNAVTVGSAGSHTLTASPTTVKVRGTITVQWTAPTGSSTRDWIGLYKVGDGALSFISWIYTNGSTSGSSNFTAPGVAGQYEFRYMLNNGTTEAARSGPVTVTP